MANSIKGQHSDNINGFRKRLRGLEIPDDSLGKREIYLAMVVLILAIASFSLYMAAIAPQQINQTAQKVNNMEFC